EALEAPGILAHRLVEAVIRVGRHRDRDVGGKALRARRAEGQYLHVDAGRIHMAQPLLANIAELARNVVADLLAAVRHVEIAELVGRDVLAIERRRVMLFDRDDAGRTPAGKISVGHVEPRRSDFPVAAGRWSASAAPGS